VLKNNSVRFSPKLVMLLYFYRTRSPQNEDVALKDFFPYEMNGTVTLKCTDNATSKRMIDTKEL